MEPILELSFGFSNIWSLTVYFAFQKAKYTFHSVNYSNTELFKKFYQIQKNYFSAKFQQVLSGCALRLFIIL